MMEVVISGENRTDDYGNFFFKDKGGTEHKIGAKRENQEELISLVLNNPDRAVQLKMDTYKGRDYITGVELLDKLIAVDKTKLTEQQVKPETPETPPVKPSVAPQELGMWWKELGEGIRSGVIERDYPNSHTKIKSQYYKRLFEVTGVDAKELKKED